MPKKQFLEQYEKTMAEFEAVIANTTAAVDVKTMLLESAVSQLAMTVAALEARCSQLENTNVAI